jgi:transposase InsO family protein
VIGISRQAVSQYQRRQLVFDARILELVAEGWALRKQHPGCGVEKMYYVLKPSFLGRDRFVSIMMEAGFRLRRSKNARRTTYAGRIRYPNLIRGMPVAAPFIIWQSDITYIMVGNKFYYAVFIIDVYSKKIVGYKVSQTMRAMANIWALAMALRGCPAPRIHHSDRGSQYSSKEYLSILKDQKVQISMRLKAQENAYAEKVNRTIKEEYLDHWKAKTYAQLTRQMKKAVDHYNQQRPHNHLNKMTPAAFEIQCLTNPKFEKPIITIFDESKL